MREREGEGGGRKGGGRRGSGRRARGRKLGKKGRGGSFAHAKRAAPRSKEGDQRGGGVVEAYPLSTPS